MTTNNINDTIPSADEWFRQGRRVLFDPNQKKIVSKPNTNTLSVFERVVVGDDPKSDARWVTLLPGFPDGSYGWSKVDRLLTHEPRLDVEYVGQGDSDKPKNYMYSTMERANLVEAQWHAHGVDRTVLVTFDYSSIVMLELLQRQRERIAKGIYPTTTRIEHVLAINGGLFADGHSHPWDTTPLLKKPILGSFVTWAAQRSQTIFDTMMVPLYSKEYQVSKAELGEVRNAITRRNGAAFVSNAAGFVDEHKKNAKRWDLKTIYMESRGEGVRFHLVGSEKDQFEFQQIVKARERLGSYTDVRIDTIPGGHLATSEQAGLLASFIHDLTKAPSSSSPEVLQQEASTNRVVQ